MICHHYKCIFVHIPKTAGQSIEHIFLELLGLSYKTRAPLLLRKNDSPELGPPMLAHLKIDQYLECKYLTEEQLNSYFKFAFVRNPWSRMISFYKYLGYSRRMSFKAFLMNSFKREVWTQMHWFVSPQSEFICNKDGEVTVDFVGRFENLQDDFNDVCLSLGIPHTVLPRINITGIAQNNKRIPFSLKRIRNAFRKNLLHRLLELGYRTIAEDHAKKVYTEFYDQESIEFVSDIYSSDIKLFGYKFHPEKGVPTYQATNSVNRKVRFTQNKRKIKDV